MVGTGDDRGGRESRGAPPFAGPEQEGRRPLYAYIRLHRGRARSPGPRWDRRPAGTAEEGTPREDPEASRRLTGCPGRRPGAAPWYRGKRRRHLSATLGTPADPALHG